LFFISVITVKIYIILVTAFVIAVTVIREFHCIP
jgi:hypothetical protein